MVRQFPSSHPHCLRYVLILFIYFLVYFYFIFNYFFLNVIIVIYISVFCNCGENGIN